MSSELSTTRSSETIPIPSAEAERLSLAYWRSSLEEDHQHTDWIFIPFRSREDFDAAVEVARAKIKPTARAKADPVAAEQAPYVAAVEFLRWIRETSATDKPVRYSDDELSAAYRAHCAASDAQPASEPHMRHHLRQLGGVTRKLSNARAGTKRHRPTVWIIQPALSATATPAIQLAA